MISSRRVRSIALGAAVIACTVVGTPKPAQAQSVARSSTKFGIYYLGWHCVMSDTSQNMYNPYRNSSSGNEPRDITKAIADPSKWGATVEFHWWSKPEDGYYCLSTDTTLLAKHANLLKEAGVDFIYYDATNWENYNSSDSTQHSAVQSFATLVDVWKDIPGAPKIAIWAPLTANGDMVTTLLAILNATSQTRALRFLHDDDPTDSVPAKPLLIAMDDVLGLLPDATTVATLSNDYTIRRMWSFREGGQPSAYWSYLERCGSNFKASGGTDACGQRASLRAGGVVEQVPVAPSYQAFQLMTDTANAVPKFRGKTFWQQFKRAFDLGPELVMITGWNEWIAQRGCTNNGTPPAYVPCSDPGASTTMSNGKMVFADQYDVEYNRDMEPAETAASMGRFYYNLMKECVLAYKADTLCSQPSTPIANFDAVTTSAVDGIAGGWAFDPNNPGDPITVHIYFYPPSGAPTVVGASTTGYRPDVNAAYGIAGNHGFTIAVPKALYNGSTYTVRVYAIDNQDPSGASNVEAQDSPHTFNYANQVPVGTQDTPASDGTVFGWAFDPNHPGEGQTIHVQYYNPVNWSLVTTAVTSTTGYRPDVNAVYGISGNHGYAARYCNGQQLYAVAYAFDLNSGVPQNLGGQYIAACTAPPAP